MYAKAGFRITKTCENDEWGAPVTEERWEVKLDAKPAKSRAR